jgi:hypothetical protein
MSVSFSTTMPLNSALDNSAEAAAPAKPTIAQQLQQMAMSGDSPALIATKLAMPQSQVDIYLGIKTPAIASTPEPTQLSTPEPTQSSTSEAAIVPGSLSVQA